MAKYHGLSYVMMQRYPGGQAAWINDNPWAIPISQNPPKFLENFGKTMKEEYYNYYSECIWVARNTITWDGRHLPRRRSKTWKRNITTKFEYERNANTNEMRMRANTNTNEMRIRIKREYERNANANEIRERSNFGGVLWNYWALFYLHVMRMLAASFSPRNFLVWPGFGTNVTDRGSGD